MDDIKDVAKAIIEPILNFAVKNSKDEEKKDDVKNEDVDKRKLIDEIGGILKDKVDDEIIRTVIKKCEELSYEGSEAGKADNKKAKNKEDEEDKEEFVEEKEIANKKAKNEEGEEKEDGDKEEKADNKCKNSMDDVKNAIFNGKVEIQTGYITKAQRLELGNNY